MHKTVLALIASAALLLHQGVRPVFAGNAGSNAAGAHHHRPVAQARGRSHLVARDTPRAPLAFGGTARAETGGHLRAARQLARRMRSGAPGSTPEVGPAAIVSAASFHPAVSRIFGAGSQRGRQHFASARISRTTIPGTVGREERDYDATGRPSAWCGWFARFNFLGRDPGPDYNLAANWRRIGTRDGGPRDGDIAVWGHHVGKIVGACTGTMCPVWSGNDGHAVRTRMRSVAGAEFRRPG
jgi:hypothetical protein